MTTLARSLKRHVKDLVPPQYVVRWHALNSRLSVRTEVNYLKHLVDPFRNCIDVGAHEGLYTYALARLSGRVHCYEPNPAKARFLMRAFAGINVTVYPYAASFHDGRALLNIPSDAVEDHSQEASLQKISAPGSRVEVETRRLDSMRHENVGFIKIDVEGHEEKVLDGARQLIARERPVLLVEIERRHTGRDPRVTFAKIMEWGYSGFFVVDGHPVSVGQFVEKEHQNTANLAQAADSYRNNFFFTPQ